MASSSMQKNHRDDAWGMLGGGWLCTIWRHLEGATKTVYCWGSILDKKSWPHSLAAPLNSVAGLCGLALWPGSVSGSCPCLGRARLNSVAWLCGRALCPGLVLLLCSSCPSLGRAPELSGRALWPGLVLLLYCSSLVFPYGRTISDVDADKNL